MTLLLIQRLIDGEIWRRLSLTVAAVATSRENVKSRPGRSAEGHSRLSHIEGAWSSIFSNCCPFSEIASFFPPRAATAPQFVRIIFHVFRRKVRDEGKVYEARPLLPLTETLTRAGGCLTRLLLTWCLLHERAALKPSCLTFFIRLETDFFAGWSLVRTASFDACVTDRSRCCCVIKHDS